MRKAVVTGANGFVGTSVCEELARRDVEVIAVVRHPSEDTSALESLPRTRLVYCDISEFSSLAKLIDDRDVDVFYHFAWVGSAGPLRGDVDVQIKNIKHTCDTVKTCASIGCKRFVFASSIMEYEAEALMETDSTPAINTLYSTAKIAADYMSRAIAGELGIKYIRAVISNIYGPGESSPRLVNTSLRRMMDGEHCSFSEGTQMYDFIFIADAAKAFASIGDKGHANRTYYIGSQNPMPLKEFLITMRNCVNPSIEIGLGEIPTEGVSLTYREFNIDAVRDDTGFVPETSFESGIKQTIAWLREVK